MISFYKSGMLVALGAALLAFRAPGKPIEMKPFSEFNGDTLRYLQYNLSDEERRTKFAGRTIGELLRHVEIPIKHVCVDCAAAIGDDPSEIGAIELYVTTDFDKGAINIRIRLSERIGEGSPLHRYAGPQNRWTHGFSYTPEVYDLIKDLKIKYHSAGIIIAAWHE